MFPQAPSGSVLTAPALHRASLPLTQELLSSPSSTSCRAVPASQLAPDLQSNCKKLPPTAPSSAHVPADLALQHKLLASPLKTPSSPGSSSVQAVPALKPVETLSDLKTGQQDSSTDVAQASKGTATQEGHQKEKNEAKGASIVPLIVSAKGPTATDLTHLMQPSKRVAARVRRGLPRSLVGFQQSKVVTSSSAAPLDCQT